MKKTTSAFAAAFAGALALAASAEATEIKAAHYLSPKHPLGVGYEILKDVAEKESGGKLTVQVFAGEALLAAKALSDGVRDGVADVAPLVMTYTPAYYAHGLLLGDLAMFGPNDTAAAFAISELFTMSCEPCQAESRAQNQIALSGFSTPQYVLVGKGAMNTLETIKGKKLRAGGPLWARFAEAVGAVAVNIPSGEIYEGLSRGVIDAAMYARGGLKTHGLADVADTVSEVPLGSFRSTIYYSYNIESWKKLTPAERTIVFKGIAQGMAGMLRSYADGEEEGVKLGKEKGVKFLKPDAALQKATDDFIEKDAQETVTRAQAKGVKGAAQFVEDYKRLYRKWEPMVTPIMDDDAKLADLLYKEVYAKLDVNTFGIK